MSIFQTSDFNINDVDIELVEISSFVNNGGWVDAKADNFDSIKIPFDKLMADPTLRSFTRNRIDPGNVIYFGIIKEDQLVPEHKTNKSLPEQINAGDIVQIFYNMIIRNQFVVSIDGDPVHSFLVNINNILNLYTPEYYKKNIELQPRSMTLMPTQSMTLMPKGIEMPDIISPTNLFLQKDDIELPSAIPMSNFLQDRVPCNMDHIFEISTKIIEKIERYKNGTR